MKKNECLFKFLKNKMFHLQKPLTPKGGQSSARVPFREFKPARLNHSGGGERGK